MGKGQQGNLLDMSLCDTYVDRILTTGFNSWIEFLPVHCFVAN